MIYGVGPCAVEMLCCMYVIRCGSNVHEKKELDVPDRRTKISRVKLDERIKGYAVRRQFKIQEGPLIF